MCSVWAPRSPATPCSRSIAIGVAGLVFGEEAARDGMVDQLRGLTGPDGAVGNAGVGSVYGAAGSLMILLVWVYSWQILFLAADFTQVWARRRGVDRAVGA